MSLEFLDGEQPPEVTAPAANPEPAPEAAPAPEGPARGPDGKFAAKEEPAPPAEQPPAPEPVAVQPVAPVIPPGHVPVDVVKALRDEIRALKQPQQTEPVQIPDPYEDPQGFAAFQTSQVQEVIYAQNLNWSRQIAEIRHTPEAVSQAHEWAFEKCEADPFFNQRVRSSADPYGVVMEEWKRDQLLSKFQPSDYDQFLAWKASQGAPQAITQPVLAQPVPVGRPPVAAPPPSLVTAPSAGGISAQPMGHGTAYDALPIP